MATFYNKIPSPGQVGDLSLNTQDGEVLVLNGYGEWKPVDSNFDGVVVGRKSGKSVSVSVLEEWINEQDLEKRYPALAAAREQYNIIKAMCQETEHDPS